MRRAVIVVLGAAALLVSLVEPAHAATHLVDFDDVSSGCTSTEVFGPPGDRYEAEGIVFEGGGVIVDACGGFEVSGYSAPNLLGFNDFVGFSGPETMRFVQPARSVSLLAGVGRAEGSVTLTAYDGAQAVDQDSLEITFQETFPMTTMTVAAPRITHVVLEIDTLAPEFGFTGGLAVDDVRWEDALSPPTSKSQCKNGGWRDLTDDEGQPFRSKGQCVRYVVARRP